MFRLRLLLLLCCSFASKVADWTVEETRDFIAATGRSKKWKAIADTFRDAEIDGAVLKTLTLEQLLKFGVDSMFAPAIMEKLEEARANTRVVQQTSQRRALEGEDGTTDEDATRPHSGFGDVRQLHEATHRRLQEDESTDSRGQCLASRVVINSERIEECCKSGGANCPDNAVQVGSECQCYVGYSGELTYVVDANLQGEWTGICEAKKSSFPPIFSYGNCKSRIESMEEAGWFFPAFFYDDRNVDDFPNSKAEYDRGFSNINAFYLGLEKLNDLGEIAAMEVCLESSSNCGYGNDIEEASCNGSVGGCNAQSCLRVSPDQVGPNISNCAGLTEAIPTSSASFEFKRITAAISGSCYGVNVNGFDTSKGNDSTVDKRFSDNSIWVCSGPGSVYSRPSAQFDVAGGHQGSKGWHMNGHGPTWYPERGAGAVEFGRYAGGNTCQNADFDTWYIRFKMA